ACLFMCHGRLLLRRDVVFDRGRIDAGNHPGGFDRIGGGGVRMGGRHGFGGLGGVGFPIRGNTRHAQHGDVLTVPVAAAAVLPAALLEDDDLVQTVLGDHG